MRILIETEEQAGAGATQPAATFNRSEASDAGPPASALLQAVSAAAAAGNGKIYRDGTDGGGPPPELREAVQRAEAPQRAAPGLYSVDGGAAPKK